MIATLGKLGIIDTSSTQYRISTKTIVNSMLNALIDREYSSLCWLHNSVFAKINRTAHLERVTCIALNYTSINLTVKKIFSDTNSQ